MGAPLSMMPLGPVCSGTLTTVYDAAGNVVQNIDALNKTTTMVFDGLNRAISVTDPMCLLINGWSSLGIPKAAT
jgi:YD repeat-containing protein